MDSISISFQMVFIFLGPMPFILSISIIPVGVFEMISFNTLSSPDSNISIIFCAVENPIPFSDSILSVGIEESCSGSFSMAKAADP